MKKIYEYRSTDGHQILTVLKWLRKHGQLNHNFKVHQLNYRIISIEFLDDKLELMYTMQYDWTKSNAS